MPLEQVIVGDIVVVYPGDQIPVDGTVLSGIGLVDQQKLTGESIPVTREEGQDVLAATLLVDGTLRIETKRTGNNTRAGVVVALMKAAPVHDTRMEDYARKIGDRIVVPTLALGGAITLATGGNIVRGVGVITLDVGTGVRVSVPTAILASLTFAARNGILMRSGRGLEQLASGGHHRLRQDRHADPGQGRRRRHLYRARSASAPAKCSSWRPPPSKA